MSSYDMHYMAFHQAAQILAAHPEKQHDAAYHRSVCWDCGIPLEEMTEDEAKFLSQLVENYYKGV